MLAIENPITTCGGGLQRCYILRHIRITKSRGPVVRSVTKKTVGFGFSGIGCERTFMFNVKEMEDTKLKLEIKKYWSV